MSSLSQFLGGNIPQWVSGATYALGDVVRDTTTQQIYVRIVAGAGATAPSADTTNWRANGAMVIKSIQRGVITILGATATATATISAVVTAKTELRFNGSHANTNDINHLARIELTNTTTITATRASAVAGASAYVAWELTEYY